MAAGNFYGTAFTSNNNNNVNNNNNATTTGAAVTASTNPFAASTNPFAASNVSALPLGSSRYPFLALPLSWFLSLLSCQSVSRFLVSFFSSISCQSV
jgi:hypothetical protein